MDNNYENLIKYLNNIENELYNIIIDSKKSRCKIKYKINIEIKRKIIFEVKYIEDIYNDYMKLYNFTYKYKKYDIENFIIYAFDITFLKNY